MPKLWDVSVTVAAHLGYNRSHEVFITVIYNLLDAGKDVLLSLPFSLYGTFVVEQQHGFNKQTLRIFITDQIKGVRASSFAPRLIACKQNMLATAYHDTIRSTSVQLCGLFTSTIRSSHATHSAI